MTTRVARVDFAPGAIEIVDALDAPTAARSPAVEHPEGYLEVDAFLARDGLLRYSDGADSWLEYRPRAEIEAAAASWAHTPVTDDHPARMVSADSWADVARGIVMGAPTVEGPDLAGISYLRARLLITDRDLVQRIRDGQRELSIGFTAAVRATPGTAPSGERYDAVQTGLDGNHVASVPRGRAGPRVRVLLDGAEIPVYYAHAHDGPPIEDPHVKTKTPAPRADELGAPVQMVAIPSPDGASLQVPTWVAAQLAELAALKQGAAPPAPAAPAAAPAPAAPAPAPPPAPVPDASGVPMGAAPPPAPAPADPEKDGDEPDDDDEEPTMTPDAINALVSKRARLVRLADRAGVPAEICDSADLPTVARAFIAKRMPFAKAQAEKAKGDALDALVDAAAAIPEPAPARAFNPFEARRTDAAQVTAANPVIKFMSRQGYGPLPAA